MEIVRRVLDCLSCRQVLSIMVILGFMLNYMLRVNLTIAIVSMVIPEANSTDATSPDAAIPSDEIEQTRYSWNEYEVNLILGSFYWGYICTELPGGRLAEIVGAKRVFGYSMLGSSALTFLTPLCATGGYIVTAAMRAVLGFFLGATWPAILPMTARWIPPAERSKFISNMLASALGAAITMPICGFLIASLGWESVFYVTGAIGLAWSAAWFLLIFDSPADHPRISDEERQYILDAIGTRAVTKGMPVPWKDILLSPPVWAIVITHTCSVYGYFTIVNQLPTYMKYILKFNIKENGLLSSLPYLGKYTVAVTMSSIADHLVKKSNLSVTVIRKSFNTFAVLTPAFLMTILVFTGQNRAAAVALISLTLTINGTVTAGYLGNGLDISPNFSGTIFGIANTLSSVGGYMSSYMVGTLTYKNQTYSQWQIVFCILATCYFCGAIMFAVFGSGELQPWNNPKETAGTSNKTEATA